MKKYFKNKLSFVQRFGFALLLLLGISTGSLLAQDAPAETPVAKPVKNTFGSSLLMDNQTVMVPVKGTMEMDIQHRFGTVEDGISNMFGLFAPSNIRLAMSYVPINNLCLGAGVTKERYQVDMNAKYALLKQTPKKMPVSVTYFGNIVIDARDKSNFRYSVDRFSYFNQLMVAYKLNDRISAQVSGNLSWFNNVPGYIDNDGKIQSQMKNAHASISMLGRYHFSDKSSIIIGYDQPLTAHTTNNPHPNICFGLETCTSSHCFQVFAGNYYGIVPQSNNMFNQNDYTKGEFVIGFNITRLWNF